MNGPSDVVIEEPKLSAPQIDHLAGLLQLDTWLSPQVLAEHLQRGNGGTAWRSLESLVRLKLVRRRRIGSYYGRDLVEYRLSNRGREWLMQLPGCMDRQGPIGS